MAKIQMAPDPMENLLARAHKLVPDQGSPNTHDAQRITAFATLAIAEALAHNLPRIERAFDAGYEAGRRQGRRSTS